MAHPREPSGPEILHLTCYIMVQDQAITRAAIRHKTSDIHSWVHGNTQR
jgi:hypothetical protein